MKTRPGQHRNKRNMDNKMAGARIRKLDAFLRGIGVWQILIAELQKTASHLNNKTSLPLNPNFPFVQSWERRGKPETTDRTTRRVLEETTFSNSVKHDLLSSTCTTHLCLGYCKVFSLFAWIRSSLKQRESSWNSKHLSDKDWSNRKVRLYRFCVIKQIKNKTRLEENLTNKSYYMNSWMQIRQTLPVQNIHVPFSAINPQYSLRLNWDFITRKLWDRKKKWPREKPEKKTRPLDQ